MQAPPQSAAGAASPRLLRPRPAIESDRPLSRNAGALRSRTSRSAARGVDRRPRSGGPAGVTRLTTISSTRSPRAVERAQARRRFPRRRAPRAASPSESCARGDRAAARASPPPRARARDQPVGGIGPADARELLALRCGARAEARRARDQRLHRLRRGEQPERVTGRRGVDDDEVVARTGRRQRTISSRPISSSIPGTASSSRPSTSSRSSQVPCSRMSPSARRCRRSQRAKRAARRARLRGSATRGRRGLIAALARETAERRARRRASARDRSTRRGRGGRPAPRPPRSAAAQVVLPTPPLPPKKRKEAAIVRLERFDVDAGDLVVGDNGERAGLRRP